MQNHWSLVILRKLHQHQGRKSFPQLRSCYFILPVSDLHRSALGAGDKGHRGRPEDPGEEGERSGEFTAMCDTETRVDRDGQTDERMRTERNLNRDEREGIYFPE